MKIELSCLILILISNLANSLPKNSYKCADPNNQIGACISIYTCPTVLKLFLHPGDNPKDEQFLQKSYCKNGFGAPPFVCCSNEVESIPDNLLATQEQCTEDSYLSLAVWPIPHTAEHCVGSLINDRYILTSGRCALAKSELIQLGEADADDITIEKRIAHENYSYSHDYRFEHDIGLLRLSDSVQFNDEIAPICLPSTVKGFQNYKIGDAIEFPVYSRSNINLEQGGEIVEKCLNNKYASDQLCVAGDISEYYEDFKYGTPLVTKFNEAWIVDSVYSFHRTESAAIFSRVSEYEKWIIENLEP